MLSERGRGEKKKISQDGEILDLMQFSQVENSKIEYESGTVSTVPLQEHSYSAPASPRHF